MKNVTLIAAAAVIVVANGAALIHATRNRRSVEAEITLTSRELVYRNLHNRPDEDDSGVDLQLSWTDPSNAMFGLQSFHTWLNVEKLRALGFDCRVSAGDPRAEEFYRRQLLQPAFVALEYDGPAWRAWVEFEERLSKERHQPELFEIERLSASHLVTIDADRNPEALRLRHPDRGLVLIVPTVIRVGLIHSRGALAEVTGHIQEVPSTIHVPRPLSDLFRTLSQTVGPERVRYRVGLRYGTFLEPWVTRVERDWILR